MGRNNDFFHGVSVLETDKCLYQTREKERKSTAWKPGDMDADDVDYEMQFGKDPIELEICGMNQSGLERFVEKYGQTYRRLSFFHCPYISDFSPLEDLKKLEMVGIDWNKRAERLWDMSKNPELWSFLCLDAKKMVYSPDALKTSKKLRNVKICGPIFGTHPIRSLECFSDIPTLEKLVLNFVKLENRSTAFLSTLPALTQFEFDPGMFTTEEIARMVAQYPNLRGEYLGAYAVTFLDEVRVSGFRKPTLTLPKDQKRLEKYTAAFKELVEQYEAESDKGYT